MDQTLTSLKIPLSVVAQWPMPNFVDPERRRWLIPIVGVVQGIAAVAVALRFWVRYTKQAGSLGLDDGLIVLSFLCGAVFTGFGIWGDVHGGFDRHIWDIPPTQAPLGGWAMFIDELIFLLTTTLTKTSVLIFYHRLISRSQHRKLMYMIYFGTAIVLAYLFFYVPLLIFICSPVDSFWLSLNIDYREPYKCIDQYAFNVTNGVWSTFTDVYVFVLPELLVKSLKITRKKKLVLLAVLSCNILTISGGIGRMYYLARLHKGIRDISWTTYNLFFSAFLELQLGILCASAPALKAFFGVYVTPNISQTIRLNGRTPTATEGTETLTKGTKDIKNTGLSSRILESNGITVVGSVLSELYFDRE